MTLRDQQSDLFKLIFGSGAELLISGDSPQLGLWEGLVSTKRTFYFKNQLFSTEMFSKMAAVTVSCRILTKQSQIKLFFSLFF